MDPRLPTQYGDGYKSASQKARRITERWGTETLYCCACPSDHLSAEKANAQVRDFLCPTCAESYQLKSQRKKLSGRVLGSDFQRMMEAVLRNESPNFFLLHYEIPEWLVRNLVVIPRFAISPSAIIRRKPLSASARRGQWTGYLLDTGLVPSSAKISLIADGTVTPRAIVRERFARIARVETLKPAQRGWTLDVLRCVEALPNELFTNDDVYAFEFELAKLYPGNRHIRDKIRQQLQVLRDRGLLKQPTRGQWLRL